MTTQPSSALEKIFRSFTELWPGDYDVLNLGWTSSGSAIAQCGTLPAHYIWNCNLNSDEARMVFAIAPYPRLAAHLESLGLEEIKTSDGPMDVFKFKATFHARS
jgi:hypothetical protein